MDSAGRDEGFKNQLEFLRIFFLSASAPQRSFLFPAPPTVAFLAA
jgi:hypothetical protein